MIFKNDFIYLFLERGEGREKEKERNISVRENPGTFPDWELNRPPFALRDNAQLTEPYPSGLICLLVQMIPVFCSSLLCYY